MLIPPLLSTSTLAKQPLISFFSFYFLVDVLHVYIQEENYCRKSSRKSKKSQQSSIENSSTRTNSFLIPSKASSSSFYKDSWKCSISTRTSLSSLRESILPEQPHIYKISEISASTRNFLLKLYTSSSSSTSWRCSLRNQDVTVFQRKFRRELDA